MGDLTKIFKALSDESRLRILNLLFLTGELCVCDIEATTGYTQTKVSRHLAYLKHAGLVDDRRQGLWILYSIAQAQNDEHKRLLALLRAILQSNSVALRDAKELANSINNGCCATFKEVKPQTIPVILNIPQGTT